MPRSLCSTQAALAGTLRSSALMSFAATMRPRSIGTRSSLRLRHALADEGVEAVGVGRLDVDEIERRRALRQRRHELTAQVAVDLDHGDEQREAEPQRQHDGRRQRARPVDVGDRKPHGGDARVRHPACDRHHQQAHQLQHDEHGGGRGNEDRGDAPVIGVEHGKPGKQRNHRRRRPKHSGGAASGAPARRRRGTAPRPARPARGRAARPRRRGR